MAQTIHEFPVGIVIDGSDTSAACTKLEQGRLNKGEVFVQECAPQISIKVHMKVTGWAPLPPEPQDALSSCISWRPGPCQRCG